MSLMSEWKDRYQGRPAAVLGGGPSLFRDMAIIPSGSILIAVNYHAGFYYKPDFMVYNDQPGSTGFLALAVKWTRAVKVSPEPTSDIEFDVPVWTGFYSSNTATWFALWLGCDPVILCGMDCYQGDVKYCHPYQHDEPNFHYGLDHHIRPWIEEARASCPHPERIRAASGPLVDVFGQYKAVQ